MYRKVKHVLTLNGLYCKSNTKNI